MFPVSVSGRVLVVGGKGNGRRLGDTDTVTVFRTVDGSEFE